MATVCTPFKAWLVEFRRDHPDWPMTEYKLGLLELAFKAGMHAGRELERNKEPTK